MNTAMLNKRQIILLTIWLVVLLFGYFQIKSLIIRKFTASPYIKLYSLYENTPSTSIYYSVDNGNTVGALSQPPQADTNPLNSAGCGCPYCCGFQQS